MSIGYGGTTYDLPPDHFSGKPYAVVIEEYNSGELTGNWWKGYTAAQDGSGPIYAGSGDPYIGPMTSALASTFYAEEALPEQYAAAEQAENYEALVYDDAATSYPFRVEIRLPVSNLLMARAYSSTNLGLSKFTATGEEYKGIGWTLRGDYIGAGGDSYEPIEAGAGGGPGTGTGGVAPGGDTGGGGGTPTDPPDPTEPTSLVGVELLDARGTVLLVIRDTEEIYSPTYDGNRQIPGWKGSDISLDGRTGSIFVRKQHDSGVFALTVEFDSDTLAQFYKRLDQISAALGQQSLTIRVTRPTGEVRLADDAYLSGTASFTTLDPDVASGIELEFTLPYPYWRSAAKVTTNVQMGTASVAAFEGITAPVEDLVITARDTQRLSQERPTGQTGYLQPPTAGVIDCGQFTFDGMDPRAVEWPEDEAIPFVLYPQPRTVNGVYTTAPVLTLEPGTYWTVSGYLRFLLP